MNKKKKTSNFRVFREERGILPIIIIIMVAVILGFVIIAQFAAIGTEMGKKSEGGSSWAGSTDTVTSIGGVTLPATEGKIGNEEHVPGRKGNTNYQPAVVLDCMTPGNSHYEGPGSEALTFTNTGNCATFNPYKTEEERYYFNMFWPAPIDGFGKKKVIITNPKNNKMVVASIIERGPAEFKWTQDGINCGGSREVLNYLETEDANTDDPNDDKGKVLFGFAKDQNIPLGPLE